MQVAPHLDPENQGVQVFSDRAYRLTEAEQMLCQKGYRSQIHEKAQCNRSLTKAQELANTRRSHHRARVEHACGAMVQQVVSFCAPLVWLELKSKSA